MVIIAGSSTPLGVLVAATEPGPSIESRVQWAASATLGLVLAAHTLMETGRDALFLANIPAERLPWVYIAGALLAVGLVRVAGSPTHSDSHTRRLVALQLLAATSVFGFWWAMGSPGLWVYYALYIWSGVISGVIVVSFWILMGEFFTVTQAKRLFAPVAMGGSLGAVGGAGIATAMTPYVSPDALLLASSAFFGLSAIGSLTLPRVPEADGEAGESPPEAGEAGLLAGFGQIVTHPYALRVALLVVSAGAALTVGDYLFKSVLAEEVAADALSTWLARIYLALNLLSIGVLWAGVRPLIARLGVDRSLILLPAVVAVSAVGILLGFGLVSVVLLKSADGTLRHSLHKTATEILYVPMDAPLRTSVKGVIDLVGNSAAKAIASLAILGLTLLPEPAPVIAALLLVLALIWAALVMRLRDSYLDVFRRTLHRGSIETRIELPELDLDSVGSLLRVLSSPNQRAVLGAMDLLHERHRCSLIPSLILYHPSPDVVERAIDIFAASRREEVLDFRERLLDHEYARVRSAIVRATAALAPDRAWLEALKSETCPCIRVSAVAGLLAHGWIEEESARPAFEAAVEHHEADTRMAVANAAKLQYSELYREPLASLAGDRDVPVAREAVRAMHQSGDAWFTKQLVRRLADRPIRHLVHDALLERGDAALHELAETLQDRGTPSSILRHIPRTIAGFASEGATQALLQGLETVQSGMVRYKILRGLQARAGETLGQSEMEPIVGELHSTVDRALHLLHHETELLRGQLEDSSRETVGGGLLVDLLRDKRDLATDRIFLLLSLLYPDEDVRKIQTGLGAGGARRQASGAELLEHLLTRDVRQAVLGLVSTGSAHERLRLSSEQLAGLRIPYHIAVRNLAEDPSEAVQAFAMYHGSELSLSVDPATPADSARAGAAVSASLKERALSIIERLPEALARRAAQTDAIPAA